MRIRVALAALLLGLVVWGAPPVVQACGVWYLDEPETGTNVQFHITSIGIQDKGKKRRVVLHIEEHGEESQRPSAEEVHSKQFRYEGTRLFHRDKEVGTLDGDELTVGKQTYSFSMELLEKTYHGMAMFKTEVTRGDKVVIEGEAVHLCGQPQKPPLTKDEKRELVKRRIAIYLAWRQIKLKR